jgi:hypothetical protein
MEPISTKETRSIQAFTAKYPKVGVHTCLETLGARTALSNRGISISLGTRSKTLRNRVKNTLCRMAEQVLVAYSIVGIGMSERLLRTRTTSKAIQSRMVGAGPPLGTLVTIVSESPSPREAVSIKATSSDSPPWLATEPTHPRMRMNPHPDLEVGSFYQVA